MPNVSNTDEITQQVNSGNTDGDATQNNQNQQQNNSSSKYVVLGCDSNGVNDEGCLSTVQKAIEQAGYQVEKLGIAPGPFADYSFGNGGKDPKGKIGVYLMAASLVSMIDASYGKFDYNVFGIRGDVTSWGTEEGFKTKGVPKDHHGDCTYAECDTYQGKTYPQLNEIYKGKCVAVPGETPEKLAQNIVAALGGGAIGGGATGGTGGGAVLIPDKTFFGLIKQIMGAVDAQFIIANNMAYLLSFKDIYEYRNQFDEVIPKIERNDVLKDSLVKNWGNNGFYNTVEVTYADGIVKYQHDNLVKQYGENVFYYDFPEDDEETAKAKADALLSAHVRDYSTNIQLSIFYNERITEGSWVKLHKSIAEISGKTHREIEQDEIKKKSKKGISSKRKGLTIENLIEKTITEDDVTKTIQVITDEEGEEYEIELEKSDYELFFVQSYTCRWDKDNSLIMDLELKYGPDTPDDPINATVGTGGGSTGGSTAVGGQAADITAFVKQCLGNSASQDMATCQKLYKCLQGLIVYSYYNCSDYTTASECYKYAHGGGKHSEGINCADTSRLVTACYKAAGFQAQVVSCDGHYWNEVMINGTAQTVDLSSGQTGQPCTHELGHRLLADVPKSGEHGDNPSC